MLPAIAPVTSADKTFLAMRHDIVEGILPAGSKLSEADLADRYKVSRAIIRESISRLEGISLAERTPNVGARVVSLSSDHLNELYEVREGLEGMAARLAASNMSYPEIAGLRNLLHSHKTGINGNVYYQQDGDVDFHYRIVQGSKNNQLIQLLMNSIYHVSRMYRVQLGMAGPRVAAAFDEHDHIVSAIENRDGELAEMLMRRHIRHTRNLMHGKLTETTTGPDKQKRHVNVGKNTADR